jgi:hypothetical protein
MVEAVNQYNLIVGKRQGVGTQGSACRILLTDIHYKQIAEFINLVFDDVTISNHPNVLKTGVKGITFTVADAIQWIKTYYDKYKNDPVGSDHYIEANFRRLFPDMQNNIIIGKVLTKFQHNMAIADKGKMGNKKVWFLP